MLSIVLFDVVIPSMLFSLFVNMQLYERRLKQARGREIPVMKALNEKFMSDEETDVEDVETFIKCSPEWRDEKLNKLIKKLDERYILSKEKKGTSKPTKARKTGPPSNRPIPVSAPTWATTSESTSLSSPATSVDRSPTSVTSPQSNILSVSSESPASLSTSESPILASPHSPDESDTEEIEDPELDAWLAEATGVRL